MPKPTVVPFSSSPLAADAGVASDLGVRCADGDWAALEPLPLRLEAIDGRTVGRLSGTPSAQMATGRAIRAAQTFFELPTDTAFLASGAKPLRKGASRARATTRSLGGALARKTISAWRDRDSGLLRLLYKEIVIRFKPGVAQKVRNAIVRESGLSVSARNPLAPDQWILSDRAGVYPGEALVRLAARMAALDEVLFATPNFVSQYRRVLPPAAPRPPSSKQWHLRIVGATRAWAATRGKRSVVVAVLDDGIDLSHPELRGNLLRRPDPDEPRDLYGRDFYLDESKADHFDPSPKRFRAPFEDMDGNDIHGTPCAGVAVGRGPKAYGLAPNCRLLPVKIFHADDFASDSRVANAIRYAARFADVLSCSWGGARNPDIEYALRDARRDGRKGRGAVVVCASGNEERRRVDYPAADPNAIAVGATTDEDGLAWYSNTGAQLCVVAPSDGGRRGIFTTDVSLAGRGYNPGIAARGGVDGLYCNDFGGTSSATPLVAGLCALLLSLQPNMTPDDVRAILIASAKKVGPASAYKANGHSNKYGYGRIDAAKAVALAKAWRPAR